MIPYGRQHLSKKDIESVVEVLRSDFLTQGDSVPAFEQKLSERVGAKHAVAVNSATSALIIACQSLGLGEGDWLWTSPNSFVASANCGLHCGAQIDFIDIDAQDYNLSIESLRQKLEVAEAKNQLPKVVVAVHFAGQPCALQELADLGRRYGFRIIEDASHAVGARYQDQMIGSCEYSDIVVFSFHPVKIITTGEGGMALTNDPALAKQLRLLRSHGITRCPDQMTGSMEGPWFYEQQELGFNFRMTDILAALGCSQLNQLDRFLEKRISLATRYEAALRQLPLKVPFINPGCQSAWHLYVIRLQLKEIRLSRRQVFERLTAAGIGVNVHYIPIVSHPYFRRLGFDLADYPQTASYYQEAITLPLHPGLTELEQDFIIKELEEALQAE